MDKLKQIETIKIDRPLTDEERSLVRWMLENGTTEARAFLDQLNRARVVAHCPCGCASVDFNVDGLTEPTGGLNILGDFLYGDEDNLCGAFVF